MYIYNYYYSSKVDMRVCVYVCVCVIHEYKYTCVCVYVCVCVIHEYVLMTLVLIIMFRI